MGVFTVAYSIPVEKFWEKRSNKKNMDYILGLKTPKDNSWKFESFDFDKSISGVFEILKGCAYDFTGNMLDVESFFIKKEDDISTMKGMIFGMQIVPMLQEWPLS